MVQFFTRDYFEELAKALNGDPEFKEKTAKVAVTILMVAKDKGLAGLLRVKNGEAAYEPAAADAAADFKFIGDYAVWTSNHRGEAPLDKLVMTGKLKFIGSIAKIMGLRNQLMVIDKVAQKIPAEL